MKPYLKKPFTKIRLVEWLKVKALSSSPSTTKKKKSQRENWLLMFKPFAWVEIPCNIAGHIL
jgi:hypothetical protein